MIALDTNVLVRFIIEDHHEQAERATRLIRDALDNGEPLFVSEIVLCELIWVLSRVYKLARTELVQTLRALLQARELDVRGRDGVRRGLDAFAAGAGDFADYLIRELATSAGYERVATFDKALLRDPGFFEP